MPFNRIFNPDTQAYEVRRDLTGPPPAPEPGVAVVEDGSVAAESSSISIPPATPVKVSMPGPRERLIDASGNLNPRWRRFFEELYRRTGAYEDNVNSANRYALGSYSSTTASLAISSSAPTVLEDHLMTPTVDSLSLSSEAPTIT